jgi:hypothetical protein
MFLGLVAHSTQRLLPFPPATVSVVEWCPWTQNHFQNLGNHATYLFKVSHVGQIPFVTGLWVTLLQRFVLNIMVFAQECRDETAGTWYSSCSCSCSCTCAWSRLSDNVVLFNSSFSDSVSTRRGIPFCRTECSLLRLGSCYAQFSWPRSCH